MKESEYIYVKNRANVELAIDAMRDTLEPSSQEAHELRITAMQALRNYQNWQHKNCPEVVGDE